MRSPLLLALGLASCHLSLHEGITVDGTRLETHHEELLTLEAWPSEGLTIESHQGDVRAEPDAGPITIRAEVYERSPGEAHLLMENGRLSVQAPGGAPCAIGRVELRVRGPVHGLSLTTGYGDVELRDIEVTGRLALSSGMGDLTVRGVGQPESFELSTGTGDIRVVDARPARFRASTGFGDLDVERLETSEAELSSGMGDVQIERSKGGRLKAETGFGDVELVESSFDSRELDTGLGSVSSR